MIECIRIVKLLKSDRRGVTAVEYAVLAGALSVGLLAAFNAFSTKIQTFLAGITF